MISGISLESSRIRGGGREKKTRIYGTSSTNDQERRSPRLLSETDIHILRLPGAETDVMLPSEQNESS